MILQDFMNFSLCLFDRVVIEPNQESNSHQMDEFSMNRHFRTTICGWCCPLIRLERNERDRPVNQINPTTARHDKSKKWNWKSLAHYSIYGPVRVCLRGQEASRKKIKLILETTLRAFFNYEWKLPNVYFDDRPFGKSKSCGCPFAFRIEFLTNSMLISHHIWSNQNESIYLPDGVICRDDPMRCRSSPPESWFRQRNACKIVDAGD